MTPAYPDAPAGCPTTACFDPGSTIAPLEFTSLAWAFVIQYLVWGSPPDAFVLLGALLIGASGLIIISVEWRAHAAR